jgi:hypothetical protein
VIINVGSVEFQARYDSLLFYLDISGLLHSLMGSLKYSYNSTQTGCIKGWLNVIMLIFGVEMVSFLHFCLALFNHLENLLKYLVEH